MRISPAPITTVFRPALLRSLSGVMLAWFGVSCRPGGEPPEALTSEQLPGAVQEAFQEGQSEEVKQAVRSVLAAVDANDDARAYVLLQELLARRDLTAEQRDTAARAMIMVGQRLNTAAASGDETAEKVMKVHQANK
jgi:hypothetical protein